MGWKLEVGVKIPKFFFLRTPSCFSLFRGFSGQKKNTRTENTTEFFKAALDSPDWEASEERQICRGEELTFLYGQFSDAQLLCNYGICPDLPGRSHDEGSQVVVFWVSIQIKVG